MCIRDRFMTVSICMQYLLYFGNKHKAHYSSQTVSFLFCIIILTVFWYLSILISVFLHSLLLKGWKKCYHSLVFSHSANQFRPYQIYTTMFKASDHFSLTFEYFKLSFHMHASSTHCFCLLLLDCLSVNH